MVVIKSSSEDLDKPIDLLQVTLVTIFMVLLGVALYNFNKDEDIPIIKHKPLPQPLPSCTPTEEYNKVKKTVINRLLGRVKRLKVNSFFYLRTSLRMFGCIPKRIKLAYKICSKDNICSRLVVAAVTGTVKAGTITYVIIKIVPYIQSSNGGNTKKKNKNNIEKPSPPKKPSIEKMEYEPMIIEA